MRRLVPVCAKPRPVVKPILLRQAVLYHGFSCLLPAFARLRAVLSKSAENPRSTAGTPVRSLNSAEWRQQAQQAQVDNNYMTRLPPSLPLSLYPTSPTTACNKRQSSTRGPFLPPANRSTPRRRRTHVPNQPTKTETYGDRKHAKRHRSISVLPEAKAENSPPPQNHMLINTTTKLLWQAKGPHLCTLKANSSLVN